MAFIRRAGILLLSIFSFCVDQNDCADPVYVVSPIVDWVKSCKEYTGRSYHVFQATDCKSYYLCEDGKHIDHGLCEGNTRFSHITAKCEPDIECFIEEKKHEAFTFNEKVNIIADGIEALSFMVIPRTQTTTESPDATPDPRGAAEDFNWVTGLILPLVQGILGDPYIRSRLVSIARTVMEQNVPGTKFEDPPMDSDRREFFEDLKNLTQQVSPVFKDALLMRLPEITRVMDSNTELFNELVSDLKAVLAPLGEDLFELLKRYSKLAAEARHEPFNMMNLQKDIETFVIFPYTPLRKLVMQAFEEMIN